MGNPCAMRGRRGPAPHASRCRSVGAGRRLAVRPRPLPRRPSDWCFLPPVIGEGVASSGPGAKAFSGGQLPGASERAHWAEKAWVLLVWTPSHRRQKQRGWGEPSQA